MNPTGYCSLVENVQNGIKFYEQNIEIFKPRVNFNEHRYGYSGSGARLVKRAFGGSF